MCTRVVSLSEQSSRSAICPVRPDPLYEISASCSSCSVKRTVYPACSTWSLNSLYASSIPELQ